MEHHKSLIFVKKGSYSLKQAFPTNCGLHVNNIGKISQNMPYEKLVNQ